MSEKWYNLTQIILQFNLTQDQAIEVIRQIPKVDVTRDARNQLMVSSDGMAEIMELLTSNNDGSIGKEIYDQAVNSKTSQEILKKQNQLKTDQANELIKKSLYKQTQVFQKEKDQLRSELTAALSKNETYVKELVNDRASFKQKINALKEKNQALTEQTTLNQDNQSLLDKLRKEKNGLETENTVLSSDKEKLNNQIADLDTKIKYLEQDKSKNLNAIKDLSNTNGKLQAQLEVTEEQNEQKINGFVQQKENLQIQLEQKENQIIDLNDQISQLQGKITTFQAELTAAHNNEKKLNEQIAKLNFKLDNVNSLLKQAKEEQVNQSALQQQVTKLKLDKANLEKEANKNQTTDVKTALKPYVDQIETLKSALNQSKTAMEKLENEKNDLTRENEKKQDKITGLNQRINDLTQQIKEIKAQQANTEADSNNKLASLEREKKALESKVAEAHDYLDKFNAKTKRMTHNIKIKNQTISDLKADKLNLDNELDDTTNQVQVLENKLKTVESQQTENKQQLDLIKRNYNSAQEQLVDIKKQKQALADKIKVYKQNEQKIKDLDVKNNQLELDLSEKRTSIIEKNNKIEELEEALVRQNKVAESYDKNKAELEKTRKYDKESLIIVDNIHYQIDFLEKRIAENLNWTNDNKNMLASKKLTFIYAQKLAQINKDKDKVKSLKILIATPARIAKRKELSKKDE